MAGGCLLGRDERIFRIGMGDDVQAVVFHGAHHGAAQPQRVHHLGFERSAAVVRHLGHLALRHPAAGQPGIADRHAHARRRQFLHQRLGKSGHRELAGAIGGERTEGHEAVDRRGVDDVAVPARLHPAHEGLAAQEHPLDVDCHDPVEQVLADRLQRLERQGDARIVAQHIDRAERSFDGLLHFGPRCARHHIMRQREGPAPDPRGLGLGPIPAPIPPPPPVTRTTLPAMSMPCSPAIFSDRCVA